MTVNQNQAIEVLGWSGPARPVPEALIPEPQRRPGPRGQIGATEVLAIIRGHAVALLLWVMVCVGFAGLYLVFAPAEYVSVTEVMLEPRRQIGSTTDALATGVPPVLDSAQADSEIEVVRSERNLRYVFETLDIEHDPVFAHEAPGLFQRLLALIPTGGGGGGSGLSEAEGAARARAMAFEGFRSRVDVRRIGSSYIMEIAFRAPNPAEAARLANSITAGYIRSEIDIRAAAVERGTEFLQDRISGLKAEQQAATDGVRLGQIPDIQFVNADARVVSAAVEPLFKSFPQSKLIILFAATAGLLSGIGLVVVWHSFDRTIRSRAQFMRSFGFDCLGALPRIAARKRGLATLEVSYTAALDAPLSDFAQSLRVLRTALTATVSPARPMAVGLVSCSSGEGRSVIAANLAYLFAASANPVVLIDGDLRNPTITRLLAPDAKVGLVDLLVSPGPQPQLPEIALRPDLAFVPAASADREFDPNLFLGSSAMQKALAEIRGRRTVVVDLPPLGLSPDALALGPLLDGVLLCAEVGRTTIDDLTEAHAALTNGHVRVLGVVLNRLPGGGARTARR